MRIQLAPINPHVIVTEKEEECPPTEPYPNGEPPIFHHKKEQECEE